MIGASEKAFPEFSFTILIRIELFDFNVTVNFMQVTQPKSHQVATIEYFEIFYFILFCQPHFCFSKNYS